MTNNKGGARISGRSMAAIFLALCIVFSLLGLGGAKLGSLRADVMSLYEGGEGSILDDLTRHNENAYNIITVAKRVLGADYTVIETDCYELARTTYQGQPTEARVKQAFFDVGPNINIELIQPDEHPSTWRHDLDARGEGVHHIAFWVKGMDTVIARLDAAGMPMTQRGEWDTGRYAYIDALPQLKTVIELLENK